MKTYSSYAEAKIANPESDIYIYKSQHNENSFKAIDGAPTSQFANGWKLCLPSNHCVTYNQCDEFKTGMIVLENSNVIELNALDISLLNAMNTDPIQRESWDGHFILQEASLKEKPKRTKVEYVQEKSFKEVLKCAIDGEVFYSKGGKGEFKFDDSRLLFVNHSGADVDISHLTEHCFYRRIETPIEWWEGAKAVHDSFKSGFGSQHFHRNEDNDTITISGEYTREQLCDIARALLEQNED